MSAKEILSRNQKIFFSLIIILLIGGLILNFRLTLVAFLSVLTFFYFINILLSAYLSYSSIFGGEEIHIDDALMMSRDSRPWPKYTILCPLYKEANMVERYSSSLAKIDYPKDKLECLLLLEEDDTDTLEAVRKANLSDLFKVLIIAKSYPQTKPKACNVGLRYATGEYAVIYDAEDRPDPSQLKQAVITFENTAENIACIQAKLNYYNPWQNFLTKMFTTEYSLWFDLILPGFQSIDAPIPLGGTSNHFRINTLRSLGGWDPYNVTEDCDLGIRLKEAGFRTVILDSTTWEEANSELKNWLRQRSRWIKGYFQTFLVHSRDIRYSLRKIGFFNYLLFALTTGFLPLASLINPFLWLTTISYFVFRPILGPVIEQFYPSYVLYPAVFCLVVGNFLYVYNYLIGTSKRGFDSLTKYGLLAPIYWLLISFASWYALIQLMSKPHYWEKTKHGLYQEGAAHA